jgi:hypothetical protein
VNDPHFIGWFPMPQAFSRFLRPLAFGIVLIGLVLAGIIAVSQRPSGTGQWDDSRTVSFEGIAVAEPYALVRTASGPVLLTSAGKFGAQNRLRPFNGQGIRATGTLLERDGTRMLELVDGDDALQSIDWKTDEPTNSRMTSVSLEGEIVDAKCHLGAMKPGDGKTHKGCAVLCLRGGVPPLFVVTTGGTVRYCLPVDAPDRPLGESRYPFVGEPITIVGQLDSSREMPILVIESIRRRR